MSKGLFITGTGTDIGKTYITALLLRKLSASGRDAAYFKAAMSGNIRRDDGSLIPGDALYVKTVSGIDQPLETMCPYVYETAVSPHLAARIEGNPVEPDILMEQFKKVCSDHDYVIAEGSGGIVCPIRYDENILFLEDVIKMFGIPCVITADAGLGTINSVALTCAYMRSHGIKVKGIIFNHYHKGDIMEEDNKLMCEKITGLPVIACVSDNDKEIDIEADFLASLCE